MRTFLLAVVFLLTPFTVTAQTTMLRLDLEPEGTSTFWAEHETTSGFTPEVIHSTAGWTEFDLGWTFHPTDWLMLKLFAGVIVEG